MPGTRNHNIQLCCCDAAYIRECFVAKVHTCYWPIHAKIACLHNTHTHTYSISQLFTGGSFCTCDRTALQIHESRSTTKCAHIYLWKSVCVCCESERGEIEIITGKKQTAELTSNTYYTCELIWRCEYILMSIFQYMILGIQIHRAVVLMRAPVAIRAGALTQTQTRRSRARTHTHTRP